MGAISYRYQAEARLELIRRKRKAELEQDFEAFIAYFFPIVEGHDFLFKDHHHQISDKLMAVVAGLITRLIINIPPGYGKTELVVVYFVAWCMANNPKCRFLHLSYADDLVGLNSVKIKTIMNTKEFQDLWPVPWHPSVNGKGHWKTGTDIKPLGEFKAVSTQGQVTGFRAGSIQDGFFGAVLIDDPMKPDDAQSDVKRLQKNRLIANTVKSRLMKEDTPCILIMQRLHDDDTTGHLLSGATGDDFELLNIPAIKNMGTDREEALWPEKDSLEYLKRFQVAAPYVFSSQYQGNPVPDDGVFFQRDKFEWYDELPDGENFGASDYATKEDSGDYTEHGIFRVTPDGKIYVVDWWSGRTGSDVWIEHQIDFMDYYSIYKWFGETGPIRSAIEPFLKRRMIERKTFCSLDWFSHAEASKEQNARGFQALVDSGRVYLPKDQPWAVELVEQLCRFPVGKFDDKVDACSLFSKGINKVWSEEQVTQVEQPQPEGLTINDLIDMNRRSKRKPGRQRL